MQDLPKKDVWCRTGMTYTKIALLLSLHELAIMVVIQDQFWASNTCLECILSLCMLRFARTRPSSSRSGVGHEVIDHHVLYIAIEFFDYTFSWHCHAFNTFRARAQSPAGQYRGMPGWHMKRYWTRYSLVLEELKKLNSLRRYHIHSSPRQRNRAQLSLQLFSFGSLSDWIPDFSLTTWFKMGLSVSRLLSGLFGKKEMREYIDP